MGAGGVVIGSPVILTKQNIRKWPKITETTPKRLSTYTCQPTNRDGFDIGDWSNTRLLRVVRIIRTEILCDITHEWPTQYGIARVTTTR